MIKFVSLLATIQWLSLGTPVYSTNKTDRHDISEILLKVAITLPNTTSRHPYPSDRIPFNKVLIVVVSSSIMHEPGEAPEFQVRGVGRT